MIFTLGALLGNIWTATLIGGTLILLLVALVGETYHHRLREEVRWAVEVSEKVGPVVPYNWQEHGL